MFPSGADSVGGNLSDSFLFFSLLLSSASFISFSVSITFLHSIWEMKIQQALFNAENIKPKPDNPQPTEETKVSSIKHEEKENAT